MDRLNRDLYTLRGQSDDPILPAYIQQDLECLQDEEISINFLSY